MTNYEDGVRLELVSGGCGGTGSCPTVYQTDRQTVVIQGYPLTGDRAGVAVPDGEQLVEIPADLLLAAADQIRDEQRSR